ncbi:MAG: pyridoxamine 5'-phosphate oxidase family protein [Bacteroidales bacterium]|nr:pyridoxamine 5'-phosphate oxidase family protein [Bacteroidales bacterium]
MRFIQFPLLYLLCSLFLTSGAQEAEADKGLIFKAATEIIGHEKYCALITLNETGQPQARMMEPFPPEEDFVIWFGTNKNSRIVAEIKNDPRVTVYYGDAIGTGYVVITGTAILVDDPEEKENHWLEKWESFYPDREATYLLIKVIPQRLEVVSYRHGLTGDSVTWRAPHIVID